MCITFLMFNPEAGPDQWQLVLINNRDEYYDRPTTIAAWKDGVLAGRDLEESKHGTWLGMKETGRLGVLMNVTEPPSKATSRGSLVMNYLLSDSATSPARYAESLVTGSGRYKGFLLVLLDRTTVQNKRHWNAAYYCNRSDVPVEVLNPGVYGFGNSPRIKPFVKVQHGLQLFQQTLFKHLLTTDTEKGEFVEDLVRVLNDRTPCFPDSQLLSQTPHLPPNLREKLSSCFVEFPPEIKYGTRTHTVILIDGDDNVTHIERTMNESDWKAPWVETKHEFRLKANSDAV